MGSLCFLRHYDIHRMGFFKMPLAKYPQLLKQKFCPQEEKNNRDYETRWI